MCINQNEKHEEYEQQLAERISVAKEKARQEACERAVRLNQEKAARYERYQKKSSMKI